MWFGNDRHTCRDVGGNLGGECAECEGAKSDAGDLVSAKRFGDPVVVTSYGSAIEVSRAELQAHTPLDLMGKRMREHAELVDAEIDRAMVASIERRDAIETALKANDERRDAFWRRLGSPFNEGARKMSDAEVANARAELEDILRERERLLGQEESELITRGRRG